MGLVSARMKKHVEQRWRILNKYATDKTGKYLKGQDYRTYCAVEFAKHNGGPDASYRSSLDPKILYGGYDEPTN